MSDSGGKVQNTGNGSINIGAASFGRSRLTTGDVSVDWSAGNEFRELAVELENVLAFLREHESDLEAGKDRTTQAMVTASVGDALNAAESHDKSKLIAALQQAVVKAAETVGAPLAVSFIKQSIGMPDSV